MVDVGAVQAFADRHGLWMIEDAAHALPAAWKPAGSDAWQRCGQGTAQVACFSFYANKTITTGEGGMAVTDNGDLAARMRMMSLHGLSHDAWGRYSGGSWDYRIIAPGFKYNLTDVAAAIGVHQLVRAEPMREAREQIAMAYREELAGIEAIELPAVPERRIHSWHLFPIRLRLDRLRIDRDAFMAELKTAGIGCSVHWRPLHLHPYYSDQFGWTPQDCPVATAEWRRLISLPIFPDLLADERRHVVATIAANSVVATPSDAPNERANKLKRTFDFLVSLVGVTLLAPFGLLVALAIKLDSRGPVFFRQVRMGRGSSSVQNLQGFRTMVADAPARGGILTAGADPRITRVGRILRKTKVDELPQLINVLLGNMSLVGPRPEVPKYVELFADDYRDILSVRPGITDPASVKYRDEGKVPGGCRRPGKGLRRADSAGEDRPGAAVSQALVAGVRLGNHLSDALAHCPLSRHIVPLLAAAKCPRLTGQFGLLANRLRPLS